MARLQRGKPVSNKLRELRFYWAVGFVVFLLGLAIYRRINRWLGTALLIVAFFEFIYWTSDESILYSWARIQEFNRFLTNEFAFLIIFVGSSVPGDLGARYLPAEAALRQSPLHASDGETPS